MAKKRYAQSRAKLASRIEELSDRVTNLDLNETTPNDLDQFLLDLSNELDALVYDLQEKAG